MRGLKVTPYLGWLLGEAGTLLDDVMAAGRDGSVK